MELRVVLVDRTPAGQDYALSEMSMASYAEHMKGARQLVARALAGDADAELTVRQVLGSALDLTAPGEQRVRGYMASYILKQAFEEARAERADDRIDVRPAQQPTVPTFSGCPNGHSTETTCSLCASKRETA